MLTKTAALRLIALAELLGTSLWFSANGVGDALAREWGVTLTELGILTSAVQAGFIAGTLMIAVTGIADRYPASRVFALSCLMGAAANSGFAWIADDVNSGLVYRFATGVALAGIYPLGMKLVVTWAPERAGSALGLLVGMLVFGTAAPHAMKALGDSFSADWRMVVSAASIASLIAGFLINQLGDGPMAGTTGLSAPRARSVFSLRAAFSAFRIREFRASAFGYFGHMWELYAMLLIVPALIDAWAKRLRLQGPQQGLEPLFSMAVALGEGPGASWLAFFVIASGGFGCIAFGRWAMRKGSLPVATVALAASGSICFLYPLAVVYLSDGWFALIALSLLLLWGFFVTADSPQFSAASALAAPKATLGSALALQNSIGFSIAIVSMSLVSQLFASFDVWVCWLLLPGPLLGLWALSRR